MKFSIENAPANTVARCVFNAGDKLTAEGGSMISMHATIEMETSTQNKGSSGLLAGVKRMVAGESFFLNHYTAKQSNTEVILSPGLNGDIVVHEIGNGEIIIQGGSYLAHTGDISLDASWQGIKNILSGESFFWVKASGSGTILTNAFGDIYCVEVDGDYIVDTGHAVAFDSTLDFKLTKAGNSWIKSMLGGEGIVLKFSGKGKVWCQSHNRDAFGIHVGSMLKPR